MCGIAGIFQYENAQGRGVDQSALQEISAYMRNRGPDGEGIWVSQDENIALAHQRLAIIDPGPGGHQPMQCRFDDHVITFNGEIYNFRILRKQLSEFGHRFVTESDTEVLLRLYQHYGKGMLEHIRGMYAFAIWDPQQRGVFLARDPYGIKPLYYSLKGGELRFASQVKALFRGGSIGAEKSIAAEASFLLTGSVMEPHTIYQDICCLPAGHTMWIDRDGPTEPVSYKNIAELFCCGSPRTNAKKDPADIIHDALRESIKYHLVSDVPVGTFLSAGIDSALVSSLANKTLESQIRSVTLGFDEFCRSKFDETLIAAETASSIGTHHTMRKVTHAEFDQDLDNILLAMDQPTIDGINLWFVSKAAAEQGLKVMLSGVGGDELFGGYPSFSDIPDWMRRYGWMSRYSGISGLTLRAARLLRFLPVSQKAFGVPKYAGSWGGGYLLRRGLFMPWELSEFMGRERTKEALGRLGIPECFEPSLQCENSYCHVAAMESAWYLRNQLLRDTDWASMAHSVEVRTPLVDFELTETVAPLVNLRPGKHWLYSVNGNARQGQLPMREKTGFTTPIGSWISHNRRLDRWKHYRNLSGDHVHWSRRYAICLHEIFFC